MQSLQLCNIILPVVVNCIYIIMIHVKTFIMMWNMTDNDT